MPWSLSRREGKWCVIKEADGSSAGCHDSRADAIKQQRALYANESRVASMYAELDAQPEEVSVRQPSLGDFLGQHELVKVVVGSEQDKALTASVVQALEKTNDRLEHAEAMTASLAAALQQIAQPAAAPVVNVTTPEVKVDIPAPQVTVEQPAITIQPAEVKVEVEAPNVIVEPQISVSLPSESRKVTFVRDPFGRLEGAEVTE